MELRLSLILGFSEVELNLLYLGDSITTKFGFAIGGLKARRKIHDEKVVVVCHRYLTVPKQ